MDGSALDHDTGHFQERSYPHLGFRVGPHVPEMSLDWLSPTVPMSHMSLKTCSARLWLLRSLLFITSNKKLLETSATVVVTRLQCPVCSPSPISRSSRLRRRLGGTLVQGLALGWHSQVLVDVGMVKCGLPVVAGLLQG